MEHKPFNLSISFKSEFTKISKHLLLTLSSDKNNLSIL